MGKFQFFVCVLVFISSLFCQAQTTCKTFTFSNKNHYSGCNDLPVLNASLHWNYHESSNLVDVAYTRHGLSDRKWIAWGINPASHGMLGCQALVAFPRSDGILTAYTSPITTYGTQLQSGNLSFPVSNVAATYENSNLIIFATIKLPPNTTTINHLWQEGPLSGDTPLIHRVNPSSPNVRSFGTIDLKSGRVAESKSGQDFKTILKYIHGGFNTLSFGILMPIGIIMARHVKVLLPVESSLWFTMHKSFQLTASLFGVGGFATGMYLGSTSDGVIYETHRNIGIALIVIVTAQVVSAIARPGKEKKARPYFNWFHFVAGFSTVALGITNIYEGLRILQVDNIWNILFTAVISSLGFVLITLEAIKWFIFMKKREPAETEKETIQV